MNIDPRQEEMELKVADMAARFRELKGHPAYGHFRDLMVQQFTTVMEELEAAPTTEQLLRAQGKMSAYRAMMRMVDETIQAGDAVAARIEARAQAERQGQGQVDGRRRQRRAGASSLL